jgi:ACS family D-galactonate transporter-like MFS transporter
MPGFAGTVQVAPDEATRNKSLYAVVALLAISVFINYIDRGNLSIAVPQIKDELHLSPKQLGILLSAFFWTYTWFQILSGWLVDRFNVNWILAGGFFVWTMATAATGYVRGFGMLLALRLILGVGESVAFPSYCKILARCCPEVLRGRANAFIMSGIAAGPAFGIFLGAMLMGRYGWRSFFITLGMLSLLWVVPWIQWMPREGSQSDGFGDSSASRAQGAGVWDILEQHSAWGTFGGLFAYNYLSYFMLTWLPFYLIHERNFSMQKMGTIGGLAYLALAAASVISGWISDAWIVAGGTPTRVRKTFTVVGLVVSSFSCLAVVLFGSNSLLATTFLFAACVGAGMSNSNIWAITQTLAGPRVAGKWTGVQNFVGNFAGLVSPALTGYVVDRTGHFFWAFAVAAGVLLGGAVCFAFVVGPVAQVKWAPRPGV